MKRKILTLVAVIALLTVAAQAQITFGVRAGVNFQNINGKDAAGDKLENDLTIGFNAGANVEIPVADEFYLQPGVLFTTKGTQDKEDQATAKLSISYIEVPINFIYKPQLGNGRLLLGFGPYVAYGIGGKYKLEYGDQSSEIDIDFKSEVTADDPDNVFYLKPLDAGANLLAGYELNSGLSFQLNAQLGLLDILPSYAGDEDDDSRFANTGFGVSIGFRF